MSQIVLEIKYRAPKSICGVSEKVNPFKKAYRLEI